MRFFFLLLALVTAVFVLAEPTRGQSLVDDFGEVLSLEQIGQGVGRVAQMAFAPGDDEHLYVATYGQGILRYDYSAQGNLSGGVRVVPQSQTLVSGGVDGSLGIAFHQDAVLGTVMYFAPALPFVGGAGFDVIEMQDIFRVTDTNGDGTWGGPGDASQVVVDDLHVTQLHEINQMQVHGDTLYVNIGSRTQNGGITTPNNGNQADPGETVYSGAVNFIEDLTQFSADVTTPDIAGFDFGDHKVDVQLAVSTDPGKLRVYSTGLRNIFGIAIDDQGDVWVSMNQNEDPTLPDEVHRTSFQVDHQFPKQNVTVGDWKTSSHPAAVAARDAGYFQNEVSPFALLSDHAAAGGMVFLPQFPELPEEFWGNLLVTESSTGNVQLVDITTGEVQPFARGLNGPLDVVRDPLGNILVGENFGQRIFRIAAPPIYDLDQDGDLDIDDWNLFKAGFQSGVAGLPPDEAFLHGDLNTDGQIDLQDAGLFAKQYSQMHGEKSLPGGLAHVPEPSGTLVPFVWMLLLVKRTRTHH